MAKGRLQGEEDMRLSRKGGPVVRTLHPGGQNKQWRASNNDSIGDTKWFSSQYKQNALGGPRRL